jgi:hypothetical protein
LRGRHYKGTAAILLDELGAAIVDVSINAIEGRAASNQVPAGSIRLFGGASLPPVIDPPPGLTR